MSIFSVALITIIVVIVLMIPILIIIVSNNASRKKQDTKKTTDNEISLKKVFPWIGWSVYVVIFLHLLYRYLWVYVPDESLAFVGVIPKFILVECLFLIIGAFVFLQKRKEKRRKEEKEEEVKKGKKSNIAPQQETTLWSDWKTYMLIVLGYVSWGVVREMHFFSIFENGPSYDGIALLPEGMLYFPITGIFYAALLGTCVILAMLSLDARIRALGFAFGIICSCASIYSFWFMPYNDVHMVVVPALRYLGGSLVSFPADPLIPNWLAGAGVLTSYIFALSLSKKQRNSDMVAVIILIIAVALFLPQLIHLT